MYNLLFAKKMCVTKKPSIIQLRILMFGFSLCFANKSRKYEKYVFKRIVYTLIGDYKIFLVSNRTRRNIIDFEHESEKFVMLKIC